MALLAMIDPMLIGEQSNTATNNTGKGNVIECNSCKGITVMCHGMKLNERPVEDRVRQLIETSITHYAFHWGKSTIEPTIAIRMTP